MTETEAVKTRDQAVCRRKWIQFSLRRFIILVTIFGVVLVPIAVPRIMVLGFLADANGRNLDRAYNNTSASFQDYVIREDFELWLRGVRSWNSRDYDYGTIEINDDWHASLSLKSRRGWKCMVFVWEDNGWKFKHFENQR
jgi:hypothetical protein